jgi:hypothetical protein
MNKDVIKGALILAGVVVAVTLFSIIATDDGWRKLGCVLRAMLHGVAISSIRGICM